MPVPGNYIFRITAYTKTEDHENEIHEGLDNNLSWKDGYDEFKKDIRFYLKQQQNNRCAFCRCRVSIGTSFSNLEHIVGKAAYPQFQFHEQNLVYSCTRCNLLKNKILALTTPVVNKSEQLFPTTTGGFSIINPYFDNYEDHIDFLENVIVVVANASTKGAETIKSYGLTRVDLAEERAYEFKVNAESLVKRLVKQLTDPTLNIEVINQIQAVINEVPNWVIDD